ncbi:MAG: hypothetical protein U9O53_05335, partial [archaeon]|nr:hypothetical protein [archaeon]
MESEGLTLAEMEKILKEYGLSVGKPYNKVPTPSDEYIIPVEGLGISEVRIPYKSSGILGTLRQESGFGIPKNKLKTYIFTGKGIIETNDLYYMSRQILDTGKKVGEALGIDETYYLLRETDYSPFSFKKSFDIDADSFLDA